MTKRLRQILITGTTVVGVLLFLFTPLVDNFMQLTPDVFAQTTRLQNPLGAGTTIEVVIGRIVRALLAFSGAIALLMFVYGGFLWLTSGGQSDRIKKGKQTLVWAVIGLVVIFTSYTLVNTVIDALAGSV